MKSVKIFIADVKLLLFTHTCPVTEFAVASHLNTANSCCHHVFLRHFRFQKCLPVYSNVKLSRYAALLITPLYLYNSVSRILSANAVIRSSIPGSCIAAPALFAVSIIANCPGR